MKKKLLPFLLILTIATTLKAQVCTPNSALQPNETDPASGQTFVNGTPSTPYEDVYSVSVPANFSQSGFTFDITNMKYMGIEGLPAGLVAEVSPADSIWPGGTIGCVKISGTPTSDGNYTLTLKQSLSLSMNGTPIPQPVPANNTTYTITIGSGGPSSINDNDGDFRIISSNGSISSGNLAINLNNNQINELNITIYNTTGQKVVATKQNTTQGFNRLNIDISSLQKGVYFVSVDSNNKRKMIKIVL